MRVQSVNSVNFSAKKKVKTTKTKTSPSLSEEDLHFRKGKGKIMRRAFALSALMLTGAIIYFKQRF